MFEDLSLWIGTILVYGSGSSMMARPLLESTIVFFARKNPDIFTTWELCMFYFLGIFCIWLLVLSKPAMFLGVKYLSDRLSLRKATMKLAAQVGVIVEAVQPAAIIISKKKISPFQNSYLIYV